MEDNNLTMADFMDEIEKSMVRIRKGDIKTAKVVSIEDAGLITNIGSHADAIVPWNEYSYEEVKMEDVQVGDTFDVLVLNTDDGDGNIIVSKKRAEAEVALENIEQLYKNHEHFVVKVKEVVKGGVIANLQGMRAFIPGSQITDVYVEDLNEFVGKEIEVEIIEFNPKNKKLVLSGKAIAKAKTQQAKKERFDSIIEGEKYTGTVTKLMPYGAFVNIGGVEGLVHNTDLSWTRIKHPSDVVKEGDKLNVTVLSIDKEKGKIALGAKDVAMDPWFLETANLEKGQVVKGKVVKFMNFGAFVSLSENVEGLLHVSQITEKRISKPEEALEIGQEVKVKITQLDKVNKKIGLSMTEVEEEIDPSMMAYMNEEEESISTMGDVLGNAFKDLFK
ncbi:MAG: 30S ribosomal protein S1 [Clostridiales bacterium]|uniref:30S ribosomal protein S1 n=1 Tax=Zhenhengia yiwuensis TaxID=2763666 RepID=A0A926EEG8_9FIRM|nr:30S ribosomal protein S1 [Zhenhengia yiwuensis]MBC8578071.1 30S ribosomal protein S1 [Zhenhengia yiwuensis]MDU6358995.1 30S ribosomal protein S1 [Clostridiales bacterium]